MFSALLLVRTATLFLFYDYLATVLFAYNRPNNNSPALVGPATTSIEDSVWKQERIEGEKKNQTPILENPNSSQIKNEMGSYELTALKSTIESEQEYQWNEHG